MTADEHIADLQHWIDERFAIREPVTTLDHRSQRCVEVCTGFYETADDAASALSLMVQGALSERTGDFHWRIPPSVYNGPSWKQDLISDPNGPLVKFDVYKARCRFVVIP